MITLLQRWELLRAAFSDTGLSPRAKLVLGALLDCLNSRTGCCHPSLDVLATKTACKRRVVSDAIAELAAGGWLAAKRRRGSAVYTLAFDRARLPDDVRNSAHHIPAEDVQDSAHLPTPDDVRNSAHHRDPQRGEDVRDSARLHVRDSAHLLDSESLKQTQNQRNRTSESDSVSVQPGCEPVEEVGRGSAEPRSPRRVRARSAATGEAFAEFWDAYPRKVARRDAEQAFSEAVASGKIEAAELVAGAKRYAAAVAAEARAAKFIKEPANWLRAERWTDAPEVGPVQSTKAALPDDGDPWLAPVLVRLADEIGADDVTSWLGRLSVVRRDADAVTLAAPSRFTAGEIETRFGDRLRSAIAAIHGVGRVAITAARPIAAKALGDRSPESGASAGPA